MKDPGAGRSYEPVADIAKGGMGRVELVVRREGSFARIYAMKRLHPELSKDPEVRAMFLEEARIAGLIRHPNVVPVLDVGEDELGPYLVMDYVEGVAAYRPLVAALESNAQLSVAFCVEIARQTAHGLAAAHELVGAGGKQLSVIHRDISPQNILLGFDGLVRVTDFGVAKALDHRSDSALLTGKLGYMSPEQIGHEPLDPRSDLFSFGVVLYELLACDRLYGGTMEEAFRAICLDPVPDIGAVRADVPAELAALVSLLLAKSPDDRPASAAVVAERLEAIHASLRAAGQEVPLRVKLAEDFAEERQRQQALVAAALERTRAEDSSLLDAAATAASGLSDTLDLPGPSPTHAEDETRALAAPEAEPDNPTLREKRPPDSAAVGAKSSEPNGPNGPNAPNAPNAPNGPNAPNAPNAPIPSNAPTLSNASTRAQQLQALAVVGGLVLVLIAMAFFALRDDASEEDAPAGATAAPARCESAASCHAEAGVGTYCDATTHRCESVVTPTCPALYPAAAATDRDAILLGTIFDRSSPNQIARERATELAIDGIDRSGGIDGRAVVLLHCDATAGATRAADELVRAGVAAIVGPSTSADVEAAFSAHADDGVLFISPSATATQLTALDPETPGLLWRTTPPDSLQAAVILSDLLEEPRAASMAIVRRSNDVYAQSLSVILQETATAEGILVDASQVFADASAIDAVARHALDGAPDAVVFLSSRIADAAAFIDAESALDGYADVRIYFADAAANDDLFTLASVAHPRLEGVRASRPAAPNTIITSEFVSDYMAANDGQDPLQFSFTAHTYDATVLVVLGAAWALADGGALTGERIARGIALLSAGTDEHRLLAANFRSTIAALRSSHPNVDVVGASGPLDFDRDTGELRRATYEMLQVWGDPAHFEVARRVEVP